jgi:hypothetical protein
MDFIAFLSIAFGLFGIFVDKYISLRRDIYSLWTEEIVYKGYGVQDDCGYKQNEGETCSLEEANKIGSKVDVYARDIYSIIRIIRTLVYVIFFVTVIAILPTLVDLKNGLNFSYLNISQYNSENVQNFNLLSGLLILISIAMISILYSVDIYIIVPHKHTETEEKLFDIWCKYYCRCYKSKQYQKYLQPFRMFEILAEKINEYDINKTDVDEIMYCIINNQITRRNTEMDKRPDNLISIMQDKKCLKKRIEKDRNKKA